MPTILVTGVSTGIGRACANLYARRGWLVVGTVRDTSAPPEALEDSVELEALDLASPGSARQLAERVLRRFGCPDVLLSNAGQVRFGPLEGTSTEALAALYQVNVFGQLELISSLVPAMRERGSGLIANVTSLGGTMTFPFFGHYNSTKWAFEGLSEGLWHELKPFGIRVKAIEPGFVETAIWDKALGSADSSEKPGDDPYARYLDSMRRFEKGIGNRTTPEACALEIARVLDDDGDQLRYPIAAYARPLVRARRLLGAQAVMRFFHGRWMGRNAG